jgi:hypothetical protein
MAGLAALGIALGLLLLFLLRKVSNQQSIGNLRRQLQACLYELRLFIDEPAIVWRAQKRLLWLNAKYLALMLRPALILAIPMLFLFSLLEPFYGRAPLAISEASLVTVKLAHLQGALVAAPILQAPPGIQVETPAVRMRGLDLICWRIRARKPGSGLLRVVFPTEIVTKKIASGTGASLLSTRRVQSWWQLFWYPTESPMPVGNVEWVEIDYPSRAFSWLGLKLSWFIWVLIFSMATVLILKRPLRVVF